MLKKIIVFLVLAVSFLSLLVSWNLLLIWKEIWSIIFWIWMGIIGGTAEYKKELINIYYYKVIWVFLVSLILFLLSFIFFKKKSKVDENWWIITFCIYTLLILVSYFVFYYDFTKYEKVDDSYFTYNSFDEQVSVEENWFLSISDFLLKQKDLLNDFSFRDQRDCILWIRKSDNCDYKKQDNFFDKNIVDKLDNLNSDMEKIITKKFVKNWEKDYIGLILNSRNSFYNSLYYLEKDDKKKWLNNLLNIYYLSNKILESNLGLYSYIVWTGLKENTIDNLNYIIWEYNLENEELMVIKNALSYESDYNSIFENIIKMEYYNFYDNTEKLFENSYPNMLINKNNYIDIMSLKYKSIIDETSFIINKWNITNFTDILLTMTNIDYMEYRNTWYSISEKNKALIEIINKKMNNKTNSQKSSILLNKFKR